MKKNVKHALSLRAESVRALSRSDFALVAGGCFSSGPAPSAADTCGDDCALKPYPPPDLKPWTTK
jgi:hypothetical protein